jgi:glutathione synthase
MSLNALFVCDSLHTFATYKDTTFAMMRECARRGIEIHVAQLHELRASANGAQTELEVFAHHIQIDNAEAQPWWIEQSASWQNAKHFAAIFMRKDPPFDVHYFVATQLLEIAQRQGVKVFNDPKALRDHGEKMSALEFAELTPPTLISANMKSLKEFAIHHEKIVAKPLDAMGGTGVFVLAANDPNLPSALEVLSDSGKQAIVAQRYIPEIVEGDKRIILIDGKPIDFALARVPAPGQSRGNLAAGAAAKVRPLSKRDREIALEVGAKLAPRGLLFIGIDVIGSFLTEINVTSPTGFQEITNQSGVDVASIFMDAVQRQL